MKIAFVVHDYRRLEGHSRYVVELATRFSQEHEVHVFANHIEADAQTAIQFHHVPSWRASALTSILTFAVGATMHVQGNFDIIHNQGLCGLRGNVFTAHICNRAWHRALRKSSGRLSLREWISGSTLGAIEHLFYGSARNCHIIAVSHRVAGDISRWYRAKAPISVIYHGVDLNTFTPSHQSSLRNELRTECGITGDELVFLFVGDLRKGARQCIRALAQLKRGHLVLVSRSAPSQYTELARASGVSDRVHFIPGTDRVQEYYGAADAFLLPTHYDAFAMVVSEAMACGLPVIVSSEAGASELIEHGVNGLILKDPSDEHDLTVQMAALLRDRAWAASLGRAARRTTEALSWDTVAAQTMRVYQKAVAIRA